MSHRPFSATAAHLHAVYSALMQEQRLWGEDYLEGLQLISQTSAEALGAHICSVWCYSESRLDLRCQALFSDGQQVQPHLGHLLKRADHPDFCAALDDYRVVAAADALNDSRLASF
ncbi:MAG TPA: hypothetical protein PK011_17500, partial [Marinagarivorans sp.]|nr:hypothetical protein [Marinagarivorans sp.]